MIVQSLKPVILVTWEDCGWRQVKSSQLHGKHGGLGHSSPGHRKRPNQKITNAKEAGGVTRVVEHLLSKC
jgi:hypothetical protein